MKPDLNRRDFLKLLASLPLLKLAGDASAQAAGMWGASTVQPQAAAKNVVVIVFDALSALHLPLHGYPRQTAPSISRFAEISTIFHRHYSSGNFTTPGT